jgi:hypothetical protein
VRALYKKATVKPADLDDCEPVADSEPQPEEALLSREERLSLRNTVLAMDEKYRAVLVLHYFNDLPCVDVSEILDIPVGTVKSRLTRRLNWSGHNLLWRRIKQKGVAAMQCKEVRKLLPVYLSGELAGKD